MNKDAEITKLNAEIKEDAKANPNIKHIKMKPRIWYVEDIHNQTSEWIKAYPNPRDCCVPVIEKFAYDDLLEHYSLVMKQCMAATGQGETR